MGIGLGGVQTQAFLSVNRGLYRGVQSMIHGQVHEKASGASCRLGGRQIRGERARERRTESRATLAFLPPPAHLPSGNREAGALSPQALTLRTAICEDAVLPRLAHRQVRIPAISELQLTIALCAVLSYSLQSPLHVRLCVPPVSS